MQAGQGARLEVCQIIIDQILLKADIILCPQLEVFKFHEIQGINFLSTFICLSLQQFLILSICCILHLESQALNRTN